MEELNIIKIYDELKNYLSKIKDKKTQNLYLEAIRLKMINSFGYCPDKTEYKKQEVKIEDPLILEYLDKVKDCIEYGVFVQDENVKKESVARMRDYIRRGGKYSELPSNLQNETIKNLYLDAMIKEIDEIAEEIENLS